jgi:hypothetical protein
MLIKFEKGIAKGLVVDVSYDGFMDLNTEAFRIFLSPVQISAPVGNAKMIKRGQIQQWGFEWVDTEENTIKLAKAIFYDNKVQQLPAGVKPRHLTDEEAIQAVCLRYGGIIGINGMAAEIKPGMTYYARHKPTGEDWLLLGVDKEYDRVCAAGWPASTGKLSDCFDLRERAKISDSEYKYRCKEFGLNWN